MTDHLTLSKLVMTSLLTFQSWNQATEDCYNEYVKALHIIHLLFISIY